MRLSWLSYMTESVSNALDNDAFFDGAKDGTILSSMHVTFSILLQENEYYKIPTYH